MDMVQQELELMVDSEAISLSKDGNRVLYIEKNKLYVYDLEKKNSSLLREDINEEYQNYFGDKKGDFIVSQDYSTNEIKVINSKAKELANFKISKLFPGHDVMISPIKISDNNIYIEA